MPGVLSMRMVRQPSGILGDDDGKGEGEGDGDSDGDGNGDGDGDGDGDDAGDSNSDGKDDGEGDGVGENDGVDDGENNGDSVDGGQTTGPAEITRAMEFDVSKIKMSPLLATARWSSLPEKRALVPTPSDKPATPPPATMATAPFVSDNDEMEGDPQPLPPPPLV